MKSWEDKIILPKKKEDIEYGYWLDDSTTPVICSKRELWKEIEENDKVKYIATPNHDTFILPGTDYETLQPVLKKRINDYNNRLRESYIWASIFGVMLLILMLGSNSIVEFISDTSNYIFLLVFGIIPILSNFYELREIKKIDESNYIRECNEIKFRHWIDQKRVDSIYIITGIIICIAIFQVFYGPSESIEISGLVKEKVREGEYWRLLTATILHGGVMHILFNAIAMYVIGKMVIRVTSFYHFIIIFLVSGFTGSIASLYLMPLQTSVGASGGIMGLIGFLLVFGVQLKGKVPRNIIKSMFSSVVLIAILGILAFDIIDNAAHFGGLLGGLLMGYVMIRKNENSIPYPSNLWIKILGYAGVFLFISTVLAAVLPW